METTKNTNSILNIEIDKPPVELKPFNIEECLNSINDKGYYQIRTLIILSILWGFVPIIAVLHPFFTIEPEYLCKTIQDDISDYVPCDHETICNPNFEFIINNNDKMFYTWMNNFDLACDNEYLTVLIGSVYFSGMILSNLIIPQICTKYGRKPVLNTIVIVYILNNTMIIFFNNNKLLLIYSLIAGFVYTGISIPAFVLNFEYTTKKSKNLFSSVINSSYSIGALIQIGIFYVFRNWKVSILFNIIVFVLIIINTRKVFESPSFLLCQDKKTDLRKNFEHIAILNKRKNQLKLYLTNNPLDTREDNKNEAGKSARSINILSIFYSEDGRKMMLIVGMSWFANSLIQYGTVFNIKKYGNNIFINAASLYIASIVSILLSSFVVDIFGTRKSLILYYIINLLANCTITIIHMFDYFSRIGNFPCYFLLFLSSFSTSAIGSLNYIYTAELFKDKDIVAAISFGSLINRLAGILSPTLSSLFITPTLAFTILSSIAISLLMYS